MLANYLSFVVLLLFPGVFSYPSADIDGIEAVESWAKNLISEAETSFAQSGYFRYPSPTSWQSEIIYEIQIDRFNNGDFTNDNYNLPSYQANDSIHSSTVSLDNLYKYRHGGDLQGIIDRLDYLKDLGISTLWLTPIFKHNGDYHGYCPTDLVEIDPGFGNDSVLINLVQEAHSRNIKIILDIVINHLCDPNTYYSVQPNHYQVCQALSDNNWNGNGGGVNGQGSLYFSNNFFTPLRLMYFFNRAGTDSISDIQGTDPAAVYGDFSNGMYDYDTRNYDFHNIFTKLMNYWIALADIDGFRLDAAKHVTEDFLAYFCSKTRNYAESLGKNNFYIIGEVAAPESWIGSRVGTMYTNPSNISQHGDISQSQISMIRTLLNDNSTDLNTSTNFMLHDNFPMPGLTAVFDFAHGGNVVGTFRNQNSLNILANYFSTSYFQTIAGQSNPIYNWNVIEIHDWPRFLVTPFNQNYARGILAYVYIATAFGIPLLYYGQEQGFNGVGNPNNISVGSNAAYQAMLSIFSGSDDSLKRQDMFMGPWRLGSAVDVINQLSYVGWVPNYEKVDWTVDPFLRTDQDMYKEIKSVNWLRRSCVTLREGVQYSRYGGLTTDYSGILAYSRIYNGDEIVIILNNSNDIVQQPNIVVDGKINTAGVSTFLNVKNNTDQGTVAKLSDGSTQLQFKNLLLNPNVYKIYVKLENFGSWSDSIQGYACIG